MHYLITAIGSYGDVHPMVGLGEALLARGHRVTVFASPYFEEVVSGAGLELVPIGTASDYLEMTKHPDLWHPRRSLPFIFRNGVIRFARESYQKMLELYELGNTVVVAHALDAAGRLLGDSHGVPVSSVVFSPIGLWSNYHAPKAPGAWTGSQMPRWFNRLQWWVANRLIVDRHLGRPINEIRRELDLPPEKHVFERWWFGTDQVLCLFPEWFAPRQPDWPAKTILTGFPLWDGGKKLPLAPEVSEFVDAGEAPIVFTPGSANRDGAKFMAAAAQACERTGRRGILLTKYEEQLPRALPKSVRHFSFVPLSQLLPRAVAFVHHGGIGSCAQGLAAGIPHLVQPLAFDQPDNADRLVRMGVARVLLPKRFKAPAVASALEELIGDVEVAARCRARVTRCQSDNAIEGACDALEALAPPPVSDLPVRSLAQ